MAQGGGAGGGVGGFNMAAQLIGPSLGVPSLGQQSWSRITAELLEGGGLEEELLNADVGPAEE
jgi:hypothetical protein